MHGGRLPAPSCPCAFGTRVDRWCPAVRGDGFVVGLSVPIGSWSSAGPRTSPQVELSAFWSSAERNTGHVHGHIVRAPLAPSALGRYGYASLLPDPAAILPAIRAPPGHCANPLAASGAGFRIWKVPALTMRRTYLGNESSCLASRSVEAGAAIVNCAPELRVPGRAAMVASLPRCGYRQLHAGAEGAGSSGDGCFFTAVWLPSTARRG